MALTCRHTNKLFVEVVVLLVSVLRPLVVVLVVVVVVGPWLPPETSPPRFIDNKRRDGMEGLVILELRVW